MSSKLGLKIKQLRSNISLENGKKFTQSDLAKALSISRSYLGDIESGRIIPNEDLLKKIANFFNIDVNEFINLELVEKNKIKQSLFDINLLKDSDLDVLITNLLNLNNNSTVKMIRNNINKLSEYEELEFKKINNLPLNKSNLESTTIKSKYVDSYFELLTQKILLLLDLERKKSEKLLEFKKATNINNNFIDDFSPIAAHDKNSNFSKEDFIHDENIMNDDDFWNN
ncbi:helix-turn-helix transcriptional regulator [Clostridium sp.]|uniref:helix-turn-helix transcriptional regulator n=1 Tax=Clostridium sp. TaxID=1506 RepID=UPI00290C1CFF|nr:helix-turn-helix transcriptional regulator [Clostridium sp.]MDU3524262.1 helix-turn-helix transcriptional regulator [Clostridium sp.]MDU3546291.1 helix-turn-helix transcriptional regulator [Clostridium sp.]MDU6363300.1 helix-turn-helix transcriptional regulator [Clostridium sp.]